MSATVSTLSKTLPEATLLASLLHHHLRLGHSISLWRRPMSDEKHLLVCTKRVEIQPDISLEDSPVGFVFAPFDCEREKIFLPGDSIYSFKNGQLFTELSQLPAGMDEVRKSELKKIKFHQRITAPASEHGKNEFTDLVGKSIEAIQAGLFEKVVPSRIKCISLGEDFEPVTIFERLCDRYPNALVSLVSAPETGTWIGATPELLVSVDEKLRFKTVALAGTQKWQAGIDLKAIAWTQKDIEEQAMVSRYIINCFKKIRLREFEEHGPKTSVAGNLIHLRTDYEVDMVATNFSQLGTVMLKLLHPTSAVCGMPLDAATKFLKENEGYDREFYSGFLGPVNFRSESHVFVNLRCMQVQKSNAILYAGAGITSDSDPDMEWEETEMKMNTLLQVIGGDA